MTLDNELLSNCQAFHSFRECNFYHINQYSKFQKDIFYNYLYNYIGQLNKISISSYEIFNLLYSDSRGNLIRELKKNHQEKNEKFIQIFNNALVEDKPSEFIERNNIIVEFESAKLNFKIRYLFCCILYSQKMLHLDLSSKKCYSLFSSDIFKIEISDILSQCCESFAHIIPISCVIFSSIYLGTKGPEISFQILLSDLHSFELNIKSVIFLQCENFIEFELKFFNWLNNIFTNFPSFQEFIILELMKHESTLIYCFHLVLSCDIVLNPCVYVIDLLDFLINLAPDFLTYYQPSLTTMDLNKNLYRLIKNMLTKTFVHSINNLKCPRIKYSILQKIIITTHQYAISIKPSRFYILFKILTHINENISEIYFSILYLILYHFIFSEKSILKKFKVWIYSSFQAFTSKFSDQEIEGVLTEIISIFECIDLCIKESNYDRLCNELSFQLGIQINKTIFIGALSEFSCKSSLSTLSQAFSEFLKNFKHSKDISDNCKTLPLVHGEVFQPIIDYIPKNSLLDAAEYFEFITIQIFNNRNTFNPQILDLIDTVFKNIHNFTNIHLTVEIFLNLLQYKSCSFNINRLTKSMSNKTISQLLVLYLYLTAEYYSLVPYQPISIIECESSDAVNLKWKCFPLKKLLLKLIKIQHKFPSLYLRLIFLLLDLRPYLFLPNLELEYILHQSKCHTIRKSKIIQKINIPMNFASDANYVRHMFFYFNKLSLKNLSKYGQCIISYIEIIMSAQYVPFDIKQLWACLWKKLFLRNTEQTSMLTILYFTNKYSSKLKNYDVKNIYNVFITKTISLFSCNPPIFQDPILIEIYFNVLKFFLYQSRAFLNRKEVEMLTKATITEAKEIHQLHSAIDATREAAIFQILVRITNSLNKTSKNNDSMSSFAIQEIMCLYGTFIHEMFIRNVKLIKLVHYHTYPLECIPLIIRFVSSAHLTNGEYDSLITEVQDIQKFIFLTHLYSHLSVRYPIQSTLDNLHIFISSMKFIQIKNGTKYLSNILEAIHTFSKSFKFAPFLAILYILQLRQLCKQSSPLDRNISETNFNLSFNQTLFNIFDDSSKQLI